MRISMFRILCVLLLFISSSTVFSQAKDPYAEELLASLSAKYKAYSAYRVEFSRQYSNAAGKKLDKSEGIITVQGPKFRLSLGGQEIICNGTTIWNFVKESNEVNISDYDPGADEITPNEIFTLYQKDYKYMFMGEVKAPGGVVQTIDLEPNDKRKEIAKVRLYISKSDKSLKRWTILERGTNNEHLYIVKKITPNPKTQDDYFTFNKSKYKNVKVIDLR